MSTERSKAQPTPSGWSASLALAATPLLALSIIVAVAVAAELVARTATVRTRLIPPSVGSRFRLLDQHLAQLDELGRAGIRLDCVILGNSLPLTAIEPQTMDKAFAERSGRRLECYNLGVPGVRPADAAALARIAFEDYGVWLVIFGTSARDFSLQAKVPDLAGLPWLRYRSGEPSPEGWLVDHSYAYRYYLLYLSWSVPKQRRFVEYRFNVTRRGYMSLRRGSGLPADLSAIVPELKAPLARQLAKGASEIQLQGLADLAALNGTGRRIVVLEMPASPLLTKTLAAESPNYAPIIQRMKSETAPYAVAFWPPPADGIVPEEGWVDLWHMNDIGAEPYSRWLGDRLAAAFAAGELETALPPGS